MTRRIELVVLGAWAVGACSPTVCPEGGAVSPPEPLVPTSAGYLSYAHAHNDYEHERPLLDALDQGFHSVEADLWYRNGDLHVSHARGSSAGLLSDLYLDPLQELVDASGSVLGDGEAFFLWLDLKEGQPELRDALHQELGGYDMLTTFADDEVVQGPVTAILTGSAESKEAYVDEHELRFAARDSNDFSPDDPPADNGWRYYALRWGRWVGGQPELGDDELERLHCIVTIAHELGRGVRFYGTPETEAYWGLAVDSGVDFIGTDELEELSTFLEGLE